MLSKCPSCTQPIGPPLSSGRQICGECGWRSEVQKPKLTLPKLNVDRRTLTTVLSVGAVSAGLLVLVFYGRDLFPCGLRLECLPWWRQKGLQLRADQFVAPSERNTTFTAVNITAINQHQRLITARRDGPTGTSYTEYRVDCKALTAQETARGESLADLKPLLEDQGMLPVYEGSSTAAALEYACAD